MSSSTESEIAFTEKALLAFFTLVGVGLFALTFDFSYSTAAVFPRITAAIIVLGSVLLLFQTYLPDPIRSVVAEPIQLVDVDEEDKEIVSEGIEDTDTEEKAETRGVSDRLATYLLLLGYMLLSYFISILWATPVFAVAYTLWFKLPRYIVALVTIVSTTLVFLFVYLVDSPLDRGLLLVVEVL